MPRLAQLIGLILWLTVAVAGCDDRNQALTSESIIKVRITQAESYLRSGQIQAAQAEAHSLLIADPDSIAAKTILIEAALRIGDQATAQNYLSNMKSEISSDIEYAELAVRAKLQRGEYRRVIQDIDRHQAIWSKQPELMILYKAQAFSNAGFFDEANQLLNQHDPENKIPLLLVEQIKLAMLNQKLETAEQMLVTLGSMYDDENATHLFLTGELLMLKRQWKEAEKTFTSALNAVPNSDSVTLEKATIYEALSDSLIRTNRLNEVAIYDRVLNQALPERETFNRKLKNVLQLIDQRKESEAISILNEMVLETRKPESAYRLLCQIYYQNSRISKAAKYCANL